MAASSSAIKTSAESSDTKRSPHRQTLWRRRKLEQKQVHALELAQELTWMADDIRFADYAEDLNKLATRVRNHGKRSQDECTRAVMKVIKYNQCQSVEDISDETNLPRAEVKQIVEELLKTGAAMLRPRDWVSGPRRMLIFLTGKPHRGLVA